MTNYPVLATASQIPTDLACELVQVPEWRLAVWVYELTGAELDEYHAGGVTVTGSTVTPNVRDSTMRLLCLTLRDAGGNRLYPDLETGIADLGTRGSAGLDRLASVARRLSRLTSDAEKDAEGNSEPAPTGCSPSDSPPISGAPSPSC